MGDCLITHYNVPTKSISSLNFHPNGKQLLASSRAGGILLYNVEKQNRPFAFTAKGFSPVRSLLSASGQEVYGTSFEGQIAMWKIHSQTPKILRNAHPSRINDMDMWKTNGLVITASNDKSIKVWDPASDMKFLVSFALHSSQVTSCCCNPTQAIILSGDHSGSLTLWDVRCQRRFLWNKSLRLDGQNPITSVDFDHTGQIFAASTEDGHLSLWDIRQLDHSISSICSESQYSQSTSYQSSVNSVALAKRAKDSAKEIIKDKLYNDPLLAPVDRLYKEPELFQSHEAPPSIVRFHPKKPQVLTAGGDTSPRIFDIKMSTLLYSFEGHESPNCACAWDPTGKMFATADSDGVIIVWKTPRHRIIPTILFRTEQASIPPSIPPVSALSPEVLENELHLMNIHMQKLNEHLVQQETRLTKLAECYPAVGGFASYEC
ncbi:hypothetical protein TRFO_23629 [Tritrichomonas foetus]|uniref:Uncharacterized protein n=1 Tax=Tritrichomonas foetus TaxID=1144522 RepID=A0A1J4KAL0_9EUKA|nr:hypothetical protein TRFO_23629 [Tritrichomonas foetus]|eukprot:OHT08010.1 hypothetical protein TRFO_23629 [Tritrichomonas foetus]